MRFRTASVLATVYLTTTLSHARPSESRSILDTTLLFDGFAYPAPSAPSTTLMQLQTYISLRLPGLSDSLDATAQAILDLLASFNINIPGTTQLATLQDRIKVLASIGLPGKSITVSVDGCDVGSRGVALQRTDLRDLGIANSVVGLGRCAWAAQGAAAQRTVVRASSFLDSRVFTSTVFYAPDGGFGVISDIDDTIKVSNVLDRVQALKALLLDPPKAVPGMPALYTTLSRSLSTTGTPSSSSDVQFVYLTAAPYQFFPFLNSFIDTSFKSASGPILTRNLTLVDIPEVIGFLTKGDENTLAYKTGMVDRVRGMYPRKKWLLVGDSTQQDPEAYGAAFRASPASVACIWIRIVDGADNSAARFEAAFEGVPPARTRTFRDAEISGLMEKNVRGGEC